ncbi:hypothetical protein Hbl1158_16885 (plasmid) [Halobaculum sp. CBA1158]|uniref:hypothetical protein n=1 Tax=Halobaculum sp. CBA1158 TaxID=2904243 RepID=UPI001F2CB1FC|nr:hypothetical protein [Halobaculum sp. CBA1158]UIP01730.1 hypothetical protein Hbl1158_16885 [Halobaculum sp. CBA1158]
MTERRSGSLDTLADVGMTRTEFLAVAVSIIGIYMVMYHLVGFELTVVGQLSVLLILVITK